LARPEVTGRRPGIVRPIEPLAFSIQEFSRAHGFSIEHYFKLQREGLGPAIMKIGARTLISREAAEIWRREREAASESPR
jgi:hypothetical protein